MALHSYCIQAAPPAQALPHAKRRNSVNLPGKRNHWSLASLLQAGVRIVRVQSRALYPECSSATMFTNKLSEGR